MKDPFQRPDDLLVHVASVGLPVLIDKAGGRLTVWSTRRCVGFCRARVCSWST
jgi:hypothetical protein